jgi:hypothetical protein
MLRTLLQFFLIGGLLFAAKTFVEGRRTEGPDITVRVAQEATDGEVDKEIREAILLNEAKRYGWDKHDPIVFTHLVRNMRFIEPDSPDSDLELYQRALEMNMQAHDPVVRSRLLYRAEEALAYVPEDEMPDRDQLEAHLQEHPDRFERESRARFQHVFLSGSKRGDSLAPDASAMREHLSSLGDGSPRGLGDPLPGLRAEQVATPSQIEDDYGVELARVVEEGIIGTWRGPAGSVYGLHFVKVVEVKPPELPSLDLIVAEVRADYLGEVRKGLRAERMEALRDAYSIRIERMP